MMRSNNSTREKIKRINADPNLTRIQKTRQIQTLLSGHVRFNNPEEPTSTAKKPAIKRNASIFDTVKGIVYVNKDAQDSQYVAAGVNVVNLPPNRPADEFCIFSREKLSNCTIGAIVVSDTRQGQLKWCYLCNPDIDLNDTELKNVHLFDVDYLCQWVQREGAEYIKCPLCRQGSKKKKNVEEQDIETMQSLLERRQQATRDGDLQMIFFIEGLILVKALAEKWDPRDHQEQHNINCDALKQVCGAWSKRWTANEYGACLREGVQKAVSIDNEEMLQILFENLLKPNLDWVKPTLSEFLTLAARDGAVDCVRLILSQGALQPVDAPALTEAIKTRNQPLVDLIISSMISQQNQAVDQRSFVCGQLFPQVIKYNMVEAAQAIIENRWHKPTPKDLDLARSVDNDVYKYLNDRQCAALSLHDDDGASLKLDDWGDDDMDEEDW